MKTCTQCQRPFEVIDWEQSHLKKMRLPEPTKCGICKEQNHWAFRNERTLYSRTCVNCKKQMISMISPDRPYKVFCRECYFSDAWDPMDTGRDFDFSRPFFEQFDALVKETPMLGLNGGTNCENSDYTNFETDDKNCYMTVGGHFNENCYYDTFCLNGKECVDNYWVHESELLYECSDAEKSYNCFFSRNISNCTDSWFLYDCRGCTNCFGCVNLRNKQYYIFNKAYSKEEYDKKIAELTRGCAAIEKSKKLFEEEKLKHPHRYVFQENSEGSTGNYLTHNKNVKLGFDVDQSEDVLRGQINLGVTDSLDCSAIGWSELVYDCMGGMKLNDVAFSMVNFPNGLSFSRYCFMCPSGDNLFGCTGLQKKSYCILNKQYTKEAYEALLPKIIEHMKKTGEWGEFFSPAISPFGYNETVAQVYFPLTKEQVLARGWKWQDNMPHTVGKETLLPDKIPDRIEDVEDGITKEILACLECRVNYKITPQELVFYRRRGLPIPRCCSLCRHKKRLEKRGLRHVLHARQCVCELSGHEKHPEGAQCPAKFETTFSDEQKEKVFCLECFQKEVV